MKNPKFTKDQLDKLEYFYEGYKEERETLEEFIIRSINGYW